jgi:RNA polymerase-binding transcription factor DksA
LTYSFATVGEVELAPEDLASLRADLHDERAFRLEQLDGIAEVWPIDGGRPDNQHAIAREEVLNALAAAARVVLTDVDAALSRMKSGMYGSCHLCDWPIPLPRLRIIPHDRYCGPCHQLKEAAS